MRRYSWFGHTLRLRRWLMQGVSLLRMKMRVRVRVRVKVRVTMRVLPLVARRLVRVPRPLLRAQPPPAAAAAARGGETAAV
jgi:hypothetical protein